MLWRLTIDQLAVIEHVELTFDQGLTVISGETGAGKSMLIDALGLALGSRASAELVRHGASRARVQAVFQCDDLARVNQMLESLGLPACGDDELLLLEREVYSTGRSLARVNGSLVTAQTLKGIGDNLVDIYGQQDHESLYRVARHRDLLDGFAGPAAAVLRKKCADLFDRWVGLQATLEELISSARERSRMLDRIDYELNEIDSAGCKPGEDDELEEEYSRLSHMEKIQYAVNHAVAVLYSGENRQVAVIDRVNETLRELRGAGSFDTQLDPRVQALESVAALVEDLSADLRGYAENLMYDEGRLQEVNERREALRRLKRKYGETIADILAYREEIAAARDKYENSEALAGETKTALEQLSVEFSAIAQELTGLREAAALRLSELVEQHLRFLDFPHARFVVSVTPKNSLEPARDGIDLIEFLWQPNPGEPAHPLSKIASGGEASRVMLAIKASLAAVDDIGTFIFDEIDSGVGGHAGQAVAHTMRDLGKARQVISISHLPAIAAAADAHLMVEKEVKAGHTETQVYALNDSERIREVARMLAGSTDDISLRHAAALMTLMGKNTN